MTVSPSPPCATYYDGTATGVGDRLEIAVIQRPNPASGAQPCPAVGYQRSLSVTLAAPFDGTTVVDRAGYVHFLAPPPGLLDLHGLPPGWLLRAQGDVAESPTGRWRHLYSPLENPGPGDPRLELYQSFGSPVGIYGGPERTKVSLNGADGEVSLEPATGEFVVIWPVGRDGLGLIADGPGFTREQVLALAESVR